MIQNLMKWPTGNASTDESTKDESFIIKFQGRKATSPTPKIKNAENFDAVKIYLKDGYNNYGKYAASVTISTPELRLALGTVLHKNGMVKDGALPFLCENENAVMGIEMQGKHSAEKKFQRITNDMLHDALQFYANELAADIKSGAKDEYNNIPWDDDVYKNLSIDQMKSMAEHSNKKLLSLTKSGLTALQTTKAEAFKHAHILLQQAINSRLIQDAPTNFAKAARGTSDSFERLWKALNTDIELTPEQEKATASAFMCLLAMVSKPSEPKNTNPVTQKTPAVATQTIQSPGALPTELSNTSGKQNIPTWEAQPTKITPKITPAQRNAANGNATPTIKAIVPYANGAILQGISNQDLIHDIYQNESYIAHMYLCSKGAITVGLGTMLGSLKEAHAVKFMHRDGTPANKNEITRAYNTMKTIKNERKGRYKDFKADTYNPSIHTYMVDLIINEDEAVKQASKDMVEFVTALRREYPKFDKYPLSARIGLLDMKYNMGDNFSKEKTPQTYKAIAEERWADVATIAYSQYTQVGKERRDYRRDKFMEAHHASQKPHAHSHQPH